MMETYYGLPPQVTYCTQCVMSNQRPSSFPEFNHTPERKTPTLQFDQDGVCQACTFAELKEREIDWEQREQELLRLLDNHRRQDGEYDCIVPGSGGKDSGFAAHILKYKYGMHPLTVTWPPLLYTDVGLQNFHAWLDVGGFDNITFSPNHHVHRLLTRLATENLLHPFQPFILGQKHIGPQVAIHHKIPLIFYGENEAEYGNPIADNATSLRDKSYYSTTSEIYLAGLLLPELEEQHGLSRGDLAPFLPSPPEALAASKIAVHYLGYYLKWTPQEAYYYATEHTGFVPKAGRSEGTYSKYNSIDDKSDGLHYYTSYIKFGLGRATYDAAQEVRNNHLTRAEGVALVRRFDGEFPVTHFQEVMDYIGMNPERFLDLCDQFRSPHLWDHPNEWELRHPVWESVKQSG